MHAARQPRSWLIFDVRQDMRTILAVLTYACGAVLAFPATWFEGDMPQNIAIRIALKSGTKVFGQKTPQPISQILPEYPRELRKGLVTGDATLRFTVTAQGKIVDLQVVKFSQREFADAAKIAVQKWVFAPGVDADRKSKIPVRLEFVFTFEFHDEVPIR